MTMREEGILESLPQMHARTWRKEPPAKTDSMALPLHAMGPPDANDRQQLVKWPFATSDLYN